MCIAGTSASEAERSTRELGRTSCSRGSKPSRTGRDSSCDWQDQFHLERGFSWERFSVVVLMFFVPESFYACVQSHQHKRIFFWSDLCPSQGMSDSKQSQESRWTSMGDSFPISFRRHVCWLSNTLFNQKTTVKRKLKNQPNKKDVLIYF